MEKAVKKKPRVQRTLQTEWESNRCSESPQSLIVQVEFKY